MEWEVNFTDEFEAWWDSLDGNEQESVDAKVVLLQRIGPSLGRPHADTIRQSRHPNMKELIVQHAGDPYRILFAFDPRREAILLIGGNKKGDKNFYERYVPIADDLLDQHLAGLESEKDNG